MSNNINKLLIDTPLMINGVELDANALMKAAEYYKVANWQQYVYENRDDANITINGALKIANEAIKIKEDSGFCQDDCISMAKIKLGYIKYLKNDFYSIVMDEGIKKIQFHGYIYNTYDGSDKSFRHVVYNNAIMPLEKYLSMNYEERERYFIESRTNIEDIDGVQAKQIIDRWYFTEDEFFEGVGTHWSGTEKDISTITMDTPCCDYVDYVA